MLLFKVICTPLLMWGSLLITRRWGAFAGGIAAGLPTISGPVSFSLAVEQGPDFAAAAALDALYAVLGVSVFTVVYAWTARSGRRWPLCLLSAAAGFLTTGWCVDLLPRTAWLSIACGLLAPPLTVRLLPPGGGRIIPAPQARWILPLEMVLATLLVVGVSCAASVLGRHWSGVLSFYPVMLTLLSPWCHATQGPSAVRDLLAGMMTGFAGGTSLTAVVLLCVQHLSLAACYGLGVLTALVVSAVAAFFRLRQTGGRFSGRG